MQKILKGALAAALTLSMILGVCGVSALNDSGYREALKEGLSGLESEKLNRLALDILDYANPEDIIITHPDENSRVAETSKISILGACDPDYTLYMNQAEVPVTKNGFFVRYVELKDGENKFVFTNNDKKKTLVIMKDVQDDAPEESELIIYGTPRYGRISMNYASRRINPDEDPKLLTPLAKGTSFKLLGEIDDYYIIGDGTYVYKAAIEETEYGLPEAVIERAEISADECFVYLKFKMNVNTLYSLDRDGNKVRLALHAARDSSDPEITGTPVTSLTKTDAGDGRFIYDFTLSKTPVGHFAEFRDGWMIVGFKFGAEDLSGAKIVLDAGHGGDDLGAQGPPGKNGPFEKDFNLYVTLAARNYLESRGAEVKLIRSDDTFVPLAGRVEEILDYKPDISVSVHANSMPLSEDFASVTGPLMFYTFDTGKAAAEYIHKYITDRLGLKYEDPIKENLALTRITNCPALLFEMSFLCNPDDYERLLDKSVLDKLGEALGMGIEDYLFASIIRYARS